MPSRKPLFFECFWRAEVGLKRETLITFSQFIPAAPCQNTPETRYCRQNHCYLHALAYRNQRETRSSHQILTCYHACTLPKQPWNTMLSTQNNVFSSFLIDQNQRETRSPRQIQQLYQFRSPSKQAWNTMLSTKHAFFDTFFAGPKSPETRSSRRKMTIFSPAIVYDRPLFILRGVNGRYRLKNHHFLV